jgi:two-component system, cell cycle sensor histidine kinase and response regulator CckA
MESHDDASGSISPVTATVRVAVRLAHNLRNLLMIMGRCIDSIRGEVPAQSPLENDLAELDRSIDRAFHLTHQLLAIGHPAPRERVVVDVNELVADARGMIERALERGIITAEYRLAATRPYVVADPYELEWVLLNLIMNSREAMPHGGRVVIGTADHVRQTSDGNRTVVRLIVADTGHAAPADNGHRTQSRRSDDSDLVAIRVGNVAILVANLGGWMEAHYQAGGGTTVHVDLPAAFGARS